MTGVTLYAQSAVSAECRVMPNICVKRIFMCLERSHCAAPHLLDALDDGLPVQVHLALIELDAVDAQEILQATQGICLRAWLNNCSPS